MTGDAIRVKDLHVRYRAKNGKWVEAVRGLTFSVRPGEVVGFLGPNGAGKSSTLKALMGFVTPSGGQCEVFGLQAGSLEAKSRIGYLPEVAMYYPFLTPVETLRLYGELQGLCGAALNRECLQLLELLGLADARNKLNRSLSKGMLQRVGIAQSLLGSPDLLILDEVTSGLDPIGRKELRSLMKQRQSEGATLFFSSHELSEVDMLCDRILLINKGVVVEERSMDELKDQLRRYMLVYSGAPLLMGLATDLEELDGERIKATFATKADLLQGLARVQQSGGRVADVVSQEGSLEEYFIEKIQEAA
ncbi:MAG TPA: ABC transporter ATP-binding protein [Fimbriimonadaceae bacterium]|nr:ABC transporter ATP-binding protein [Fimbriimonadaceae bacterium]